MTYKLQRSSKIIISCLRNQLGQRTPRGQSMAFKNPKKGEESPKKLSYDFEESREV